VLCIQVRKGYELTSEAIELRLDTTGMSSSSLAGESDKANEGLGGSMGAASNSRPRSTLAGLLTEYTEVFGVE
jgi:hypothetical protein